MNVHKTIIGITILYLLVIMAFFLMPAGARFETMKILMQP